MQKKKLVKCSKLCNILNSYAQRKDLQAGRRIHLFLIRGRLDTEGLLVDHLIRFYTMCGRLQEAQEVFSNTQIGDLKQGRVLHDRIIKSGFHVNVAINSSLVNIYMMCGSLHEGQKVFDTLLDHDVMSWGALMAGYIQHGYFQTVIESFAEMQEVNIEPDGVILLSLLRACSGLGALREGWHIHDLIVRRNLECCNDVGNVLVSVYVGCGSLEEARRVFDVLPKRNEVTWGAMITGYVNEGETSAAFELLDKMPEDHLIPDEGIYLSALKACAIAGAVIKGMLVHDQVIRNGLNTKAIVSNMLVHMYAGFESSDEACRVFEKMPQKDVVSWSALITGLASVGKCKQAEELLVDMQHQRLKPDDAVFTIILSVYTQNGLLEEGLKFYRTMRHVQPTLAHFNCLINLFSRTGCLNEAKELSQAMPFLPDVIGRTGLLTSSNTFCCVEVGRKCFDQVGGLDFLHQTASIVRVSSVDVDTNEVNRVQKTTDYLESSSKCGKACFEVNSKVPQLLAESKRWTLSNNDYHLGRLVLPTFCGKTTFAFPPVRVNKNNKSANLLPMCTEDAPHHYT